MKVTQSVGVIWRPGTSEEIRKALNRLANAIDFAGTKEVKLMALDNPDLEPLWSQIGET